MKPNTIIFDLDGTLIDSRDSVNLAIECAIKSFNLECGIVDQLDLKGQTLDAIGALLEKEFKGFDISKFKSCFMAAYDDGLCNSAPVYHDIFNLLNALIKKFSLVIVTNKREVPTLKILEHHNLTKYFSSVYCIDTIDGLRSKSEILKYLKSKYLSEKIVCYVGDTQSDMLACSENSIHYFHASWGYEPLDSYEYTLENPMALFDKLCFCAHI